MKTNQPELKLLIDSLPARISYVDAEQCYRFNNKAYEDWYGLTSAKIYGKYMREILEPAAYAENLPYIEKVLAGQQVAFERSLIHRDGSERYVHVTYVPDTDSTGKTRGFFVLVNDITAQKKTEQTLQESEKRLRRSEQSLADFFENGAIALRWVAGNGIILRANQAELDLLGYTAEEYIGRHIAEFYADQEVIADILRRLTNKETVHDYPARMRCKDGSIKHVLIDTNGLWEDGKFIHSRCFTRDVTGAKRAEEAIRFQASLLDAVGQSVIATDLNGTIIYWNKFAETLYGWKSAEIIGRNIMEITVTADVRNEAEKIMSLLRSGQCWSGEFLARHKDGRVFPISVTDTPIFNADGEIIGIVGVSSDITEQKRTQEELIKAKNLESIGLLAGGIAHDFNNILTAILGNVALAKLYTKPGDKISESLTAEEKAFARARDLTQQLLTFSKGGAPIKKTGSIGETLKDTASFILSGSNVSCEWQLPEDLWPINFDPGQISQVLNNLVLNAKQAMPEGGKIKVCGENVTLSENQIVALPAGRYIKLSIADHGIGIPKQYVSKIFDPYFTTKQQGSGLGLATVYSIIKRHEGGIVVDSTVGVGTTFSIYLPASNSRLVSKVEEIANPPAGKGKILLMDDEAAIRTVMGGLLAQLGYQITFARDGAELLQIYQNAMRRRQPFDAVIMDLTVPGGMGGKECIRRLKIIDPQVKAIVSSGYSNDPVMAEYEKYGFCGVINKPYQLKELSETLYSAVIKCPS